MSNLITVIGAFLIVFTIIKRAKKINEETAGRTNARGQAGTQSGSSAVRSQAVRRAAVRPRGYTNYKPHRDITSVSRDMGDKNNSVLRDDKTNDWLARQLRDEHKAFKMTSEMFDLKIEHASHCDARLLEQFHRRNCTAEGVDLANGHTAYK